MTGTAALETHREDALDDFKDLTSETEFGFAWIIGGHSHSSVLSCYWWP